MKIRNCCLVLIVCVSATSCNLGVAPVTITTKAASTGAFTDTYALPPASTITVAVPTNTPAPSPTATKAFPYTIQEETRYEGVKDYSCDARGCWRVDGILRTDPDYFFPEIDAINPDIQALLDNIGLPITPVMNENEKWERIMVVWSWLNQNALDMEAPGGTEPYEYLESLSYGSQPPEFPSIDDRAKVFARFQVFSWTGCTGRALAFTTLLYRFGIHPDDVAVAYFKIDNPSRQHLYAAVRVEGQWLYIDPSCVETHPELSNNPESVRCGELDYTHPVQLIVLPGSTLPGPMLLQSTTD